MHHPSDVPTPSLSWQPLKQSNFTPVLQLRSSSCPPWLPAPHRSGRSLPTAGLAFSVAAQRNPKVTSGFLLMYHQKHQAKGIFLPHNCPTGSWRRRCRDGTGNQQPIHCMFQFAARSSRRQVLVRPLSPCWGGVLRKDLAGSRPLSAPKCCEGLRLG